MAGGKEQPVPRDPKPGTDYSEPARTKPVQNWEAPLGWMDRLPVSILGARLRDIPEIALAHPVPTSPDFSNDFAILLRG